MTSAVDRTSRAAITWVALGATVLGVAFAVRPVHASREVFWVVAFAGSSGLLAGATSAARGALARVRRRSGPAGGRRHLLALECRRVHDAIAALADERERLRPSLATRLMRRARESDWRAETARGYRDELGGWACRVFDAAAAEGVASPFSRPLVEAPTASQLALVRDVFREAAVALERR
jgi:hypothetical protein